MFAWQIYFATLAMCVYLLHPTPSTHLSIDSQLHPETMTAQTRTGKRASVVELLSLSNIPAISLQQPESLLVKYAISH